MPCPLLEKNEPEKWFIENHTIENNLSIAVTHRCSARAALKSLIKNFGKYLRWSLFYYIRCLQRILINFANFF